MVVAGVLAGVGYFYFDKMKSSPRAENAPVNTQNLPVFNATSLLQYDGTNEKLPVYVGLDGYVYDVTPGEKFYVPGGIYHDVAGKDASNQLHIYGGDIIKEKYKVVGIFSN